MKSGPIIIIDDDIDDRIILEDVIKELNYTNVIKWFDNCDDALNYLRQATEHPFVIFCDINLPPYNGLKFKKKIDAHPSLRKKSIPFIFYSTAVQQETVNKAYNEMTIQGFFQKVSDIKVMRENIKLILDYWTHCRHPNNV